MCVRSLIVKLCFGTIKKSLVQLYSCATDFLIYLPIFNVHIDNLLRISWHDSAWIPVLNGGNVLDYFAERSNPFYDRTCNNEIVKMQRLNPEQLT
jgi:hypothetical protein